MVPTCAAVANVLEKRTVKRKTLIISKGDPATEMYFVVRGSAVVLAGEEDKPSESLAKITSKPDGNPVCVHVQYLTRTLT